ncbi:DEAD/DEAH box helicase [Georgenia sp. TF02-10]|uniref:DEAD/DEAH box helicase n=1 Tax=Georgenia sp. TF02-10 TaxID=2917725 RepID=UPI001FA803B3|nr:DEAD/DEAH box helicase [Georgenia sp. TF02-10]UNX56221.1 DEAD/DEAH box helicase [Georgenia sp. TF02-10]
MAQQTAPPRGRVRKTDNEGIIPVLARLVREVEAGVQRRRATPSLRTKFQVLALLVREERAKVKADPSLGEARRAEQLKRLDGIAVILAKTAARDTTLLGLLDGDTALTDAAKDLRRTLLREAGIEVTEDVEPEPAPDPSAEHQPVPPSVVARQLANPFLAPDYSAFENRKVRPRRLAGWELLGPLFRSFELGGTSSCMDLPEPAHVQVESGLELMPHQARVVAAAAAGHRTFLLADEPGLGKTAQALLAAEAAGAYPLLVVVPNVVKANWAREAGIWTPRRRTTVVQGDGDTVDGFADIVVVNYELLDRHLGWLGDLGFRGMVVDEAHYIKNKRSQRSQHVLEIAERIRARVGRPLLMALTGTPLINDIEDFRAIWQFLGWIDEKEPRGDLMAALEEIGRTPADPGFYPAARQSVIEQGIVRRRKVEVAADIPQRRVADLPVELDDQAARTIRTAEEALTHRLVSGYRRALEARGSDVGAGIDMDLARQVARRELAATAEKKSAENVFTMMRRLGQAKAGPGADYAAQLVRSVGKVVFFAKHVDVMDAAEEIFAGRGLRSVSIRGDQSARARQQAIDSFTNDPDVAVAVCSLTAAGVGLNLQVASNMVLAELSWTDAEQTQAIDRIHRIGQDEPVTAWRIIAAHTIDARIAELIDSKAGLAARALDGSDAEITSAAEVQVEALVALLAGALSGESVPVPA